MSNLTPFSYFNATTLNNINENYLKQNASLINETLNIISPCYSGPAFIPKDIVNTDSVSVSNQTIQIINNLNNSLGTERQNLIGHTYDQFSYYTPNYGYKTISLWNLNGGINSVHTRILGIGNGELNESTGLFNYSGFHVNNSISKGTLNHTRNEYNRFAIAGGDSGTTNFLCNRFRNANNDLKFFGQNIFDEFGFNSSDTDTRNNTIFINNCFFTAEGISPIIVSAFNNNLLNNQINNSSIGTFTFSTLQGSNFITSVNGIFKSINLKGHKNNNKIKIKDNNTISILENNGILQNNFDFNLLREKGHVSWFFNEDLKLLNRNDSQSDYLFVFKKDEDQVDQIDYCSFEDKYQTAKTPWVTSQPVDRSNLTDISRINIHQNVDNLFRFYALDDGEVGNRFRIKINPTHKGSYSNNDNSIEYAKFDIYIMQYDSRDNSYEILENYTNVCLDKDDKNYICRVIGTKYKYYDFSANKIVENGIYENKSKYLRVEITDEIEYGINKHKICKYIPSGFRAYHHLYFDKNSFENYNNTLNNFNIIQTPIEYIYYKNLNASLCSNITNHWGVQFRRSKKDINKLVDKYTETKSGSKAIISVIKPNMFSPHYFYTRFFSTNRTDNKNIWRQDDTFCNSYFNLEKICYKENIDDAVYLRSGSINQQKNSDLFTNYKFINLDDNSLYENNSLKNEFANKLSFDFFTYGGFDGTNYLDFDKRYLTNNAIIREGSGEYENSNIDGPTYNAYKKAIDITTNYENCNCDILVIPGLSDISLIDKCINIAEEQRRFIFISDISGYSNSNNIINSYNEIINNQQGVTDILPYFAQISNKGLMNNNYNILRYYNIDNNSYTINKFEFIDINELTLPDGLNLSNIHSELIKGQVSSLINNFSSRYYMPIYVPLQYKFNDNINLYLPSESIVPALFLVNNFNLTLTGTDIKGIENTISLIKDIQESIPNDQLDIVKEYLRLNNINYISSSDSSIIKLISEHSSYTIRDSIFREIVYVRVINLIKKLVKFNIFLDSSVIDGGILFYNNSKIKNVYQKFEIQMRSLFDRMVSIGLLNSYVLNLPKNFDDPVVKRDMENYIIRGTVILKLTSGGGGDIIRLELDEILSNLSLFTDTSSYNDTSLVSVI